MTHQLLFWWQADFKKKIQYFFPSKTPKGIFVPRHFFINYFIVLIFSKPGQV